MDKCPKCGGKVKVMDRSLEFWGGIHCIADEENCHSLQQINAEIAAIANELEFKHDKNVGIYTPDVIRKLRQLSGVLQHFLLSYRKQ